MQDSLSMSSIELVLADYFKQKNSELPPATPLYFIAYSAIHKAISEGYLEAGQIMPSLKELAKLFGVSITTVISAVRLLTDEGLVCPQTGRGVYVLPSAENMV